MRIRFVVSLVLLAPVSANADVSQLDWLSGCWSAVGQDAGSGEQWSLPAGGTLFGTSRTVDNGKTVAFEYLRIVTDDDGGIALIASPSGQDAARFELLRMLPREVSFENPNHDFPQRIIYRLDDKGNLIGRIEGTIDGQQRSIDFPMARAECGKTRETK